ncbi:MAG: LysR family transcriptional regulator [Pseudomonadota bacterium]
MNLKLRHLTVFHAVMEEGSVSKAADRLGLTQPAVSMALTTFEETLGYSLFNRSKGHFAPRPEAEQLYADAELSILAFERFAAQAEAIGKGALGLVRVGTIGSTAHNLMPDVISEFSTRREEVEVQVQVRSSASIAYLVANGQIDIGIVEAPVSTDTITSTRFSIPCVAILPADDPLLIEPVLKPKHLEGRRLISVYENHPLDRQMRAAFAREGVQWRSATRCYFFTIMRNLVARGSGVAVVDSLNGCPDLNDGVTWRPFRPKLSYDIAIITRADARLPAPAAEFLKLANTRLRELERDLVV